MELDAAASYLELARATIRIIAPERPGSSILDADATPEDPRRPDPTVDPASVVSDLEPAALDRLDQVQILAAEDYPRLFTITETTSTMAR
jgi:hypothetical protein